MKFISSLAIRTMVLLLSSMVAAIALNHIRNDRLPWLGEWKRHVESRALQSGLKLVGIGTVRQALENNTTRLLDARPSADFRTGHMPHAISLPLEFAADLLSTMQIELLREQPIITYCARQDCDEGLELALFLYRAGYTNVTLFAGGLNEWRTAGGAVEVGP